MATAVNLGCNAHLMAHSSSGEDCNDRLHIVEEGGTVFETLLHFTGDN